MGRGLRRETFEVRRVGKQRLGRSVDAFACTGRLHAFLRGCIWSRRRKQVQIKATIARKEYESGYINSATSWPLNRCSHERRVLVCEVEATQKTSLRNGHFLSRRKAASQSKKLHSSVHPTGAPHTSEGDEQIDNVSVYEKEADTFMTYKSETRRLMAFVIPSLVSVLSR